MAQKFEFQKHIFRSSTSMFSLNRINLNINEIKNGKKELKTTFPIYKTTVKNFINKNDLNKNEIHQP